MPHHPHTAATARIETPGGDVLGAGFLVDDEHLLTCGHLFNDAAEMAQVRLLAEPERPREVEILQRWVGEREDLAVLRLVEPKPEEAAPVDLKPFEAGGRFLAQGFPGGSGLERGAAGDVPTDEEGSTVQGSIQLGNLRGWVQLEPDGARTVHPGFSGAAVWSEAQRAVVGMVVARADDEVAYMIPQEELRSLWPSLTQTDDYRCMAEPPEGYVPRGEYRKVLVHLVEAGGGSRAALTTGLRGAGGFGKTTLAQALCQDPQLRQIFPDGVLWATLGDDLQEGDRLAAVRDLLRWWSETEPPAFERVPAAAAGLRDVLHGKRVLVVADDVWDPLDLEPFQRLPATCGLLITTRDSRNLPADCAAFEIDEMEAEEASQLLGSGLPPVDGDRLATLADRLGEWPLLLGIVNRQLRDLVQREGLSGAEALGEIEEALEEEGLVAFDRDDTEARDQAVRRTLEVSLRRLGEDRDLYERLAVFPKDVDVPLAVVSLLWDRYESATRRLARRLHRLSLLRHFDARQGTLRLHDVLREYLRRARRDDLSDLHRLLLNRLRPESGRWPDLDPGLAYPWHHLTYHLSQAGCEEELRRLLLDYRWLQTKLEATDIVSLRLDFSGSRGRAVDPEIAEIAGALRLASHILARDPGQLAAQLWGRLEGTGSLKLMLNDAAATASGCWLRPLSNSFTVPSGQLLSTLEGLKDRVWSVTVLPDGRIVSASNDNLRIWDSDSGETVATLKGHENAVYSVAVLPDGRLVSASQDRTLRIWDPDCGKSIATLEGHEGWVRSVAVLPDGRPVSASDDRTLRIWDPNCGKSIATLEGHKGPVTSVAVLPDGRLVSASHDRTLRIWDPDSRESVATLEELEETVLSVAVLPDGRIVYPFIAGPLRIWNPDSGESIAPFEGHDIWVTSVAVLPDGRLVSAHVVFEPIHRPLQIWDPDCGKSIATLEGHEGPVTSVAVFPDGRIISASDDRTLRIWDPDCGKSIAILEGHEHSVEALAWLPAGPLVSASRDHTLQIWDPDSGESVATIEGHIDCVVSVAVLPDGRLVSASDDRTLRIWDLDCGQSIATLEGHKGPVVSVAVLPDGRLVSASDDRTLQIWDPDCGKSIATLEGHKGPVVFVAALPDGRLVSASHDRTLRIWDPDCGESIAPFEGHDTWVTSVAALPDGRLVSASHDRTLRIWDPDCGKSIATLEGHKGPVVFVAALPDGRLVSASHDRTLRIWDPDCGKSIATLEGHKGPVVSVAVLPDGRLASASQDHTLRIWDPGALDCLFTLRFDRKFYTIACSPDGESIAVGDLRGRVHFLRVEEA